MTLTNGSQVKNSLLLSILIHLFILIPLGSQLADLDFSPRGQSYVAVNLVSRPKVITPPKREISKPRPPKIKPVISKPKKGSGGRREAIKNHGNNLKPMTFESIIKHYVPPTYSDYAIRNEMEGEVILKLEINKKGKVTKVKLLQSSDYDTLDLSAIKAAYQWTFKNKDSLIVKKSIIFRLMANEDPDGLDDF